MKIRLSDGKNHQPSVLSWNYIALYVSGSWRSDLLIINTTVETVCEEAIC